MPVEINSLCGCFIFEAGVAYAKDYEVTKKTGDYSLLITIDKNPPIAGENNVGIAITEWFRSEITRVEEPQWGPYGPLSAQGNNQI